MNKSAVALISGGVDSVLAAKLAKDAGIEIHGLYMKSVFFGSHNISKMEYIYKTADIIGIPLTVFDCQKDFMEVLRNPRRGYGKNINPCIDCHAFFIRKAMEFAPFVGASFVVTGEVLGQRPMSQNERSLLIVEKDAGCQGKILRPLSAELLPPTEMEKIGLVDRSFFLDISGRSRNRQLELVKEFGLDIKTDSAGGCYLTDKNYSQKVIDYLEHYEGYDIGHISLMPYGRHLRLSRDVKLIVGRDEAENLIIERHGSLGALLYPDFDTAGPSCLLIGEYDKSILKTALMIVSKYCDGKGEKGIIIKEGDNERKIVSDEIDAEKLDAYRIIK